MERESLRGIATIVERENARVSARLDTDFVFVDMEHTPFNMEALANFVAAMNDQAHTARTGSVQPRSALFVRRVTGSNVAPIAVR